MNDRIRSLRPGEKLPEGEPRRYVEGRGYIRLRWKVGRRAYVETYEHRVEGDHVTYGEHVHHKNQDPADNSPDNLVPLTPARHRAEHRRVDRERAVTMYREGESTIRIGQALGCDPAYVSRLLRAEGVRMRPGAPTQVYVDPDRLSELHGRGWRVPSIARELRVGEASVRRAMRDLGLPSFPAGRPSGDAA